MDMTSSSISLGRRGFLSSAALLGASAVLPATAAASAATGTLKFCAFADIHYFPGVFPHDTRAWLEKILARAESTACDMVIHMGDFTHAPARFRDYVDFYNDFKIPAYHTIGNHDDDGNTHEETLAAYRLTRGYYHFDRGGYRFVVTDTNHFLHDGTFSHYSKSNYHKFWKLAPGALSRLGAEQLAWLKDTVENSPYPVVVTSHASFERVNGSPDGTAVRKILAEANARHPGRVRLVINGHHHHDHVRILDGIVYLDLNSANYDWVDKPHAKYPADYLTKWKLAKNTIMWDDPISAIITLTADGGIKVEGQKSRFHLGITPAMAGYPIDDRGRLTTPDIQSFELRVPTGA